MNLKQKLRKDVERLEKNQSAEAIIPQIPSTMAQPPWMQNPMNYMPPPQFMNPYQNEEDEYDRDERKKKKKADKKRKKKEK